MQYVDVIWCIYCFGPQTANKEVLDLFLRSCNQWNWSWWVCLKWEMVDIRGLPFQRTVGKLCCNETIFIISKTYHSETSDLGSGSSICKIDAKHGTWHIFAWVRLQVHKREKPRFSRSFWRFRSFDFGRRNHFQTGCDSYIIMQHLFKNRTSDTPPHFNPWKPWMFGRISSDTPRIATSTKAAWIWSWLGVVQEKTSCEFSPKLWRAVENKEVPVSKYIRC